MTAITDKKFIEKNVTIKNIDRIKDILEFGKGGIVITAHIGNWEYGGVLLGQLGYPLMAIALPHKERPVNDLFNHQREVNGMSVVSTQNAYRTCIERLQNNGLVAIAADRDFSLNGEVLNFLGKKMLFPKGPALLSIKTGAPIIPVFLLRNDDQSFTLTIEDPIFPVGTIYGNVDDMRVIQIMKQYVYLIEKIITKYPSQWMMFREFWIDSKTNPDAIAWRKMQKAKKGENV